MSGPLTGQKVLDLSRILAGPTMTQHLADLGAEVVKIERPGRGDDTRTWGPPWVKDMNGNDTRESGYYMSANRGKHSVAVDIATPEGAATVARLAERADILVENFKVGGLAKYGLDYATLSKANPGLIYLSITGFGQTGPDAAQPGYDYLIQARSGLMSITGQPETGPTRVGVATSDLQSGLMGTIGVLAALHHRERTGEGQHIDLALLDVQVSGLVNQGYNYLLTGNVPGLTGDYHPNLAPYQPFPSSDGSFIIAVGNDTQFVSLCNVLGIEGVAKDERFSTMPARNQNREAMVEFLSAETVKQPSAHWLEALPANNVPACPINTMDQTFADPQVQARGMAIELDHPVAGKVPGIANPLKFSKTQVEYKKAPPMLGEDTDAVLERWLGEG
ncbi:CaiB/BaiF CoA transferase family protein [Pseudahrensia aquimaris]|uniref:CaiB/BaiF CoA transferase family protein n=1 Tax=Pseudahrensia aquimaris TaxID=744461 RepID=A0ABW3FCY8_9HYPH